MSSSSKLPPPQSSLPNIDPRQMAVLGVDTHLPAVPVEAQTPDALRQRFALPPLWQPEIESEKSFS
ncbi:MAG: coenzyme A pyrophosphatase, partial [Giesbergeria sp.]|nr:coenzyme A pyrophosphatase [Giesbergeria sp.]